MYKKLLGVISQDFVPYILITQSKKDKKHS